MTKLTAKKKDTFLGLLAEGSSVTHAAKAVGCHRQTMYQHRHDDESFGLAWDQAIESGTDLLEDEAIRRAMDASDTLMIFMLKARRPDKFKDKSAVDHKSSDGSMSPQVHVHLPDNGRA